MTNSPGNTRGGVLGGDTDSIGFDDEITIRVPARSIDVAVLRPAIAGVAARCDVIVEEIEDLRIAFDEGAIEPSLLQMRTGLLAE